MTYYETILTISASDKEYIKNYLSNLNPAKYRDTSSPLKFYTFFPNDFIARLTLANNTIKSELFNNLGLKVAHMKPLSDDDPFSIWTCVHNSATYVLHIDAYDKYPDPIKQPVEAGFSFI